jgi:hypothetical protein
VFEFNYNLILNCNLKQAGSLFANTKQIIKRMDKEIIYVRKLKVDHQSHKIIIESRSDGAGNTRFYASVDKGESLELLHNPDSHQWEESKVGETELAKLCEAIIEDYYS